MVFVYIFLAQIFILFFLSKKLTNQLARFFYKVTKSEKWTTYFMAILFLPGTFIHEASHFLMALFLFVPVGQMELIPEIKKDEGRVKMGSIPVGKTDFLRRALIGLSPFLFGLGIILGTLYYATSAGLLANKLIVFLLGYLVFQVSNTMFLSKKDLEGMWVFFVVVFILIISFYYLGVRFETIESARLFEFTKSANKFLAVPLIIDFVLIILLSFTT